MKKMFFTAGIIACCTLSFANTIRGTFNGADINNGILHIKCKRSNGVCVVISGDNAPPRPSHAVVYSPDGDPMSTYTIADYDVNETGDELEVNLILAEETIE